MDKLSDLKPGDIVFAGPVHFKIHKVTKPEKQELFGRSTCVGEKANAKTVPIGFTRGELHKDFYRDFTLIRFKSGDPDAWVEHAQQACKWGHTLDVTYAAVGEGEPITKLAGDLKGITKLDLIAYVIKVHGPSFKDDILRMVAALEGGPWVPTSNQEYFQNVKESSSKHRYLTSNTEATMVAAGKVGRKKLFGLGAAGENRAAMVLARLGEGPARQAK